MAGKKAKARKASRRVRVLECPYCHSRNLRHRKRTDDYVCRRCGTEFVPTM